VSTQRMTKLRAHWRTHVTAIGAFDAGLANKTFDDLCTSYSEPQRHYHTLDHVVALFDTLEEYADEISDPSRLAFAVWYHDAIYNPEGKDNEERSAERAKKELKALGAHTLMIDRVSKLILATKNHMGATGGDYDDDVFLDADFAILGAPAAEYQHYLAGVREEYAHLGDDEWKKGRGAFLERIVTAPRIFRTGIFEGAYGAQARANIKAELRSLELARDV
jgi:predicted metal-dependent HD superfamily phosphohydrolase